MGAPAQSERPGYHDLKLTIHRGAGFEYEVQATSAEGAAAETLALADLDVGSGTLAATPASARDAGERLFNAVFAAAVGALFARSRAAAVAEGRGLRIRLRVEPPELATLPWEFLYDGHRAEHVALSTATPLVRSLNGPGESAPPVTVPAPLRILGIIADPTDLAHLRSGHERELVEEALAGLQARGLVELRWLEQGTWRELQRAMRLGPWHVLHFVGHGEFDQFRDEGFVLLLGETGAAEPLSASELARLLADSASMQLAVLNSCEGARGSEQNPFSGTAATLVRRGVPAVVAMQDAVSDRAAIEFGRAFYEAVADGAPVDAAVTEARKSVSLAIPGTVEWATPVLYAHEAAEVLFRVEAEDWAAGGAIGTLPVLQTPLVGRLREVAEIGDLLRGPQTRLVTLTGTGGIGKTRLAIECARRVASAFPDGVDFITLAGLSDDADQALLAAEIARVLGIEDTAGSPLDSLRRALAEQRRLLVIDNCERQPAAGPLVAALLTACPRLKVLATSRSPLRAAGQQEYPVSPLGVPDPRKLPPLSALARVEAVTLFVARAQEARPDFVLSEENAATVARICARLDGLPLAIELAAARMRVFPPEVLMEELDHRFELLTEGTSEFSHQQALETTIAWSYDKLSPADQALFRRLAAFVGGFTLEAVRAVAPAAGEPRVNVVLGLANLAGNSLLRLEDDRQGTTRWSMLESLRAFGGDRLDEAAEAEPIRSAHAAYFLNLTKEAAPNLAGREQQVWLDRLAADHDNLRAGIDWALATDESATAIGIVETLWRFWSARGLLFEGRRRVEEVIARFDTDATALDARLFIAAGTLARAHGDYAAANRWFERGLERARANDDQTAEATLLHNAGNVALSQGDHRRAGELFEASLAIIRDQDDRRREANVLFSLGAVSHYLGDVAKAEESYEAALAIWEAAGDRLRTAAIRANLALLLVHLPERRQRARDHAERSLTESRALSFPTGIAAALTALGFVHEGEGELSAAADAFEESITVSRDAENRVGIATGLGNLAVIVADQGDVARAFGLGAESLKEFLGVGDETGIATAIEQFAGIARVAGDAARAARLHGAAAAQFERLAVPIPVSLHERHERSVAALREALGSSFESEWHAGTMMTPADILASASVQEISA